MKIKKSHSKERGNQLIPIHNKTYTYDGDLINTQNCKFEGKLVGSLPCIKFTNMKDFEQPHVPRNMIGKNVLFSIKYFSESSNFLHPYDKMSNQFIESYSFQSNFHNLIYVWLEESYLKRFHFHFLSL